MHSRVIDILENMDKLRRVTRERAKYEVIKEFLLEEFMKGNYEAAFTREMSGDSRDRPYIDHFGPLNKIPALTATASRNKAGKIHISICNIGPNNGATVRCRINGQILRKCLELF